MLNDKRTRMHRALDAVMDGARATDGTIGNPYFSGQFEVGDTVVLRGNPGAKYKVIKFEGNGSVLIRMFIRVNGVEHWDGPLTVVGAKKAEQGEIKKAMDGARAKDEHDVESGKEAMKLAAYHSRRGKAALDPDIARSHREIVDICNRVIRMSTDPITKSGEAARVFGCAK